MTDPMDDDRKEAIRDAFALEVAQELGGKMGCPECGAGLRAGSTGAISADGETWQVWFCCSVTPRHFQATSPDHFLPRLPPA